MKIPNEIGEPFQALFDRMYIINLDYRTDRKEETELQLNLLGLSLGTGKVRRFSAVRPEEKGPWPSVGARGCFMSHLAILREARADRLSSVAIVEDDCDWSGALLRSTEADISALKTSNWLFLHGGLETGSGPVLAQTVEPLTGLPLTHFIALRGDAIGRAVAYLEAMIERPPGSSEGGPMHVDGAYSWFRRDNPDIPAAICVPALGRQRSSTTDIAEQKWFDKTPVLKPVIRIARKIKSRYKS